VWHRGLESCTGYRVAPTFSVRDLCHITFLEPRISRWLLEFWKNLWNPGLKFCTCYRVAPKFSVRDFFHVTLLEPRVSRWFLDFRKVYETLDYNLVQATGCTAEMYSRFAWCLQAISRYVPLTLRLLMSYIYGAPILDVSRSHTTTHHSR